MLARSESYTVVTVTPAAIKAALSVIPWPVGAAVVPPVKVTVPLVIPAATHRAKMWFTLAAVNAQPVIVITFPFTGTNNGRVHS